MVFSSRNNKRRSRNFSIWFAFLFICLVGVSKVFNQIPLVIFLVYIALSIITFLLYAYDKRAAVKGKWRTQESTLQLLSLAGGWPGALIGQQIFRHKTKKRSFRIVFWIVVFANICIFGWLHTEFGKALFLNL